MTLVEFWAARWDETLRLFEQHVLLVVVSTGLAVAAGVPAGVLAARQPRLGRLVLTVANAAQTIPSLALLGFLLPLPFIGGVGPRTALVALFLYALLPIVRTTVTGIRSVDPAIVEAGVAMGMTRRQLLWIVELPLAVPSIIAGIRVATVIGVGTTTIAAAIGAGGLGEYIFRGLAMVDTTTILAGAVPAAALALAADGLLALLERRLRERRLSTTGGLRAAGVALVAVVVFAGVPLGRAGDTVVVVGSKNFTEQVILGEILAQAIEADGEVRVVRRLNLGGTFICDQGLRSGEIDVYVEYTGTAVSAIFDEPVPGGSRAAFERTRELYAARGITVLDPLGFNNTFAILVRSRDAGALGLETIDDLRTVQDRFVPGFGYEFTERADGYAGLVRRYGLAFTAQPRAMELSLIYQALAGGQVDVIAGDATSAQIEALDLTALADTRAYFPPYDAVPLVRTATVLRHPSVARAIEALGGRIPDREMRAMNAAVDVHRRDVRTVAQEFLSRVAAGRRSADVPSGD